MHPRPAALPYLQVALAATAWGTWSLFLRPAAVDARWSSAIMLGVVAVVCAPLLLRRAARGPGSGPPRRLGEWGSIALLGVFDALNASLFFAAMAETTVAIAVLSHYLAPLLVALSAPSALGTPRDRRAVPLATLAGLGLALVLEPWRFGAHAAGRPLLGALLGAGSAIFYAANVLLTKRMRDRFTAEEQLVWHSVLSTVLLVAAALALHAPLPSANGLRTVAIAGAVIGASAGLLFLYGLRRIPAEHAGMLTFLEPLTAVVVAWLAWGERPGALALVGALLVVTSGALAIRTGDARAPAAQRASTPL